MKFIICGGGTGGHVSPAIAIYDALKEQCPNAEFLFVGRDGGAENHAYRATGERLVTLSISGISRKSLKKAAKGVLSAVKSQKVAKSLIKTENPDVIIGTGGYVCWPIISVGAKMGIPTIIHESNALPGLTTRMLCHRVDLVLLNCAEAAEHLPSKNNIHVVGNPLRKEFQKIDKRLARRRLGVRDNDIMILSFGGSLGAQKLNEVVINLMRYYSSRKSNVKHLHATGAENYKEIAQQTLTELSDKNGCKIVPYIEDMATAMSAADVVISRCGAMTLSEICAVGVAAVLIPSPNVADNHQFKNAKHLERAGAAIIIDENSLSLQSLMNEVRDLVDSTERRISLATEAANLGKNNALDLITKKVLSLTKQHSATFFIGF